MKKHNIILNSITSIALTGLWLVCPAGLFAQGQKAKSEIGVSIAGPASFLDYDAEGIDVNRGEGFSVGLDYTYFFSNSFGVLLGAEYQMYNTTAKSQNISEAYDATDFEGESFQFRYTMEWYEEKQKLNFVNIPLMLVYQNEEHGFFVKAGAKIGLPVSGKFKSSYDLTTSGYYPQYNGELFDPAFMGFGKFDNIEAEDDIDVKPSYIASIELGLTQPVGKSNLYAGLYFDYGLNDISDKKSMPVDYSVNGSGAGFGYNSLLNTNYVNEVKTMAFGIKLRYSVFNF